MVEKKSYRKMDNSMTPELTIFLEFSVYKDTEKLFSNGRNGQTNEKMPLRDTKLQVQIALLLLICLHGIMHLRSPKEINDSIQKALENCFPLIYVFIFRKSSFQKATEGARRTLHLSKRDGYIEKPFCMGRFYRRLWSSCHF